VQVPVCVFHQDCDCVFVVLRMGDIIQPRANVDMHDKTQIRMIDDNIQLCFFTSVIFFYFPTNFCFVRIAWLKWSCTFGEWKRSCKINQQSTIFTPCDLQYDGLFQTSEYTKWCNVVFIWVDSVHFACYFSIYFSSIFLLAIFHLNLQDQGFRSNTNWIYCVEMKTIQKSSFD